MQPPADDAERGRMNARMQPDLLALLDAAAAGELSSAEFSERLAQIHAYYLDAAADGADYRAARAAALKAFEALTREPPSRHHELEALAETLGLDVG